MGGSALVRRKAAIGAIQKGTRDAKLKERKLLRTTETTERAGSHTEDTQGGSSRSHGDRPAFEATLGPKDTTPTFRKARPLLFS